MAVIRVHKTKDYTVMSNYHLRDKELSLKAKGLLSFMLSLPDDWDYSINGLVAVCKEGEASIKATLKELEICGYLKINKLRETTGKFVYEYNIYEKPHGDIPSVESPQVENPGVENPPVENPGVENQGQINTNKQNTNKQNTNNIRHKYGMYNNVLFTDSQLSKLKEEFPNDWEYRIDNLSEYMKSTGKSYKDHLATIRAWARKEKKHDNSKEWSFMDL